MYAPKRRDNRSFIMAYCHIVIFLCSLCIIPISSGTPLTGNVVIDAKKQTPLNKLIFGSNIIGNTDPGKHQYFSTYTQYGGGIWDPVKKKAVPEILEAAKNIGISSLRYPGGCATHLYNWRNTVGKTRKIYDFGLDEFLQVCNKINAEPIITISFFTGTHNDAAELVEYLNKNYPKRVKYFEIGNEVYHGDHQEIKEVSAQEYASKYLQYYKAIKSVDSEAQVGAIFFTPKWNKKLLNIIDDNFDFAILHLYPKPFQSDNWKFLSDKQIFNLVFLKAIPSIQKKLIETSTVIKERTGKVIPIAITEYNGGFIQNYPVKYRFSLGNALVNGELLRIFSRTPQVFMANNWHFINGYWGLLKSYNKFGNATSFLKRPNYYIYKLYKDHFGEKLLSVHSTILENKVSFNASTNSNGTKIYIWMLNKMAKQQCNVTISIRGFNFSPKATIHTLTGPRFASTNEDGKQNVRLKKEATSLVTAEQKIFEILLAPHSLTSIELVQGN